MTRCLAEAGHEAAVVCGAAPEDDPAASLPADLPVYEQRLADAIEQAIRAGAQPCDVSGLSWERLTDRVLTASSVAGSPL